MSFGGTLRMDQPYGIALSLRAEGWVLDVSGPFGSRDRLPAYGVCPICPTAVHEHDFSISEIPLSESEPRARCPRGHLTVLPAFYSIFDNTSRLEPRMLHVRRATERLLLGSGWITRAEAAALFAAAKRLAANEEGSEDAARRALSRVTAADTVLPSEKRWTLDRKLAIASLILTAIVGVAPLLLPEYNTQQLFDLIERQQQILERDRDPAYPSQTDDAPRTTDGR